MLRELEGGDEVLVLMFGLSRGPEPKQGPEQETSEWPMAKYDE
jgi:hypothetical protein